MVEIATTAARNLSDCCLQGWDVALTDKGPVILELESDGGCPSLGQLCYDRGIISERYLHAYEYGKNRVKREHKAYKDMAMKPGVEKIKGALSGISMLKAAQEGLRVQQSTSKSAGS